MTSLRHRSLFRFGPPGVDQDATGLGPRLLEIATTLRLGSADLAHQRFAQRVMAPNQELIAIMQEFKEPQFGDSGELAVRPAVAAGAGKNEVPDPVDICYHVGRQQGVREEVVNIGVLGLDVALAVEAPALLVAVQRLA